jgi:DivIVA domain-containing protein
MTAGRIAPRDVVNRTFTRVVRGYKRREVDRLLRRAAADLIRLRDGTSATRADLPPPLTAEDIEQARFRPALGGYEMNEVDEFLDVVAEELTIAAGVREQAPPAGDLVEDEFAPAPPSPSPPPPPPPPAQPRSPADVSRRVFSDASPGYLPDEVDRFLVRAAQALAALGSTPRAALPAPPAGPEPASAAEVEPTLTRWHVLRQRFPLGPRGYAMHEVDAYLVELAALFPEPGPEAQQEILRQLRLH